MKKVMNSIFALLLVVALATSTVGCVAISPNGKLDGTDISDIVSNPLQEDTESSGEGLIEEDTNAPNGEDSDSTTEALEDDFKEETITTSKDDDGEEASTEASTTKPGSKPTEEPTTKPASKPTEEPTTKPASKPTEIPTTKPTQAPTQAPTSKPTQAPTQAPTSKPTQAPTQTPTTKPTQAPTTQAPTTQAPTTTASVPSGGSDNTYSELQSYSNIYPEDVAMVRSILSSIVTNGMSDLDKIKAVHDYLVKNTTYDYGYYGRVDYHDQLKNILFNKVAVCQGYTVAFYVFMKELGIPCTLLAGNANNGNGMEAHAWNAVKINGEWYFVDVTWDDPIVNGSTNYPDGYNLSYEYLLCTYQHISATHTYDDYIGEVPTPYGTSTQHNDYMYQSLGIDGIYRISSLDKVMEVGASVNDTCTYMFIIEGGAITINEVVQAFFSKINGRVGGELKYSYSDKVVEITFTKS